MRRANRGLHLAVIGDRGNPLVLQVVHRALHLRDGGRVDDHAIALHKPCNARHQPAAVRLLVALLHDVTQVGAMEAGDVLVRLAKLELVEDILPHAPRGAGGKRGDGHLRKILAAAS